MTIAICNHKGGTAKTTTTINLGRALAMHGHPVLLIDLDSQANLTYSLGIGPTKYTVSDILTNGVSVEQVIVEKEGMHVLPANRNLVHCEEKIIRDGLGYSLLKNALSTTTYKYVLIDCPPSHSVLNLNAFCAASRILIPMLMDVLSLQGLNQIMEKVEVCRRSLNPDLHILGVVGVMVDERKQLTRDILEYIQGNYDICVFNNHIRSNVKAAEAPSFGKSVIEYAPESNSAKDYLAVCAELLYMTQQNSETNPKMEEHGTR